MTITEVLQELNVPHAEAGHRHVTHGWVGVDCPRCSPGSGSFKLGIHAAGGWANCWSCGGQNPAWALAQASGRPRHRVEALLAACYGAGRVLERRGRPEGVLKVPKGLHPLAVPHQLYLTDRGFDPFRLERLWGLKATLLHPTLPWRIWIPIHHRGEVVSWTTRSIVDHGRRYRGAGQDEERLPARSLLYGADYCRHAVIVVEGPTDAWRIGPGAAATMGIAYTPAQVLAVGKFPVRVIAYDREPAAQRRAKRLGRQLQALPGKTYRVVLESADDPGGADPAEVAELRRKFLEPQGVYA